MLRRNIKNVTTEILNQKLARMEASEEAPSTSNERKNSISSLMPRVARHVIMIFIRTKSDHCLVLSVTHCTIG